MNSLKKYLGIIWILLAIVIAYFGYTKFGLNKLNSAKQEDVVLGIITCFILLPIIVIGLLIFGKYAWQNEYELVDERYKEKP